MIQMTMILGLFLAAAADEIPAGAKPGKIEQGKPAAPVASAQEVDRPVLSAAEIKSLRDNNVFAPKNRKRVYVPPSKGGSKSDRTAEAPKPRPPVVTGIFFDGKADTWIVVVEDRNEGSLKLFKEPKFLKLGEEVAGFKVGSVLPEKATFVKGEISKELKVGESLPTPDGKPVPAATTTSTTTDDSEASLIPDADAKVEIKPLDPETSNKTLEDMKKKVGKKNRPSKDE